MKTINILAFFFCVLALVMNIIDTNVQAILGWSAATVMSFTNMITALAKK